MTIHFQSPRFVNKGPTGAQQELQQAQTNFYNEVSADYSLQFAHQSAILGMLTKEFEPILKAGPEQYGFSKALDSTLRAEAIDTTGAEFKNASTAVKEQFAARGGGNTYLPSGAEDQVLAGIDVAAATQESNQMRQITDEGYAVGRENFKFATSALDTAAGMQNPVGYAGAATSAGSAAGQTASEIAQEEQAASPWGAIGGILGGGVAAFAGNPHLMG